MTPAIALPQHVTKYGSYYDEGDREEYVMIYCPKCTNPNDSSWGCLEKGTTQKCDFCAYEWELIGTEAT